MVEIILPNANTPPKGIVIQTRMGSSVGNANDGEATPFLRAQLRELDKRYPSPSAIPRTDIITSYNCHGLTFGSRRSRIDDDRDIQKILREDKYAPVDRSQVQPGDVILYVLPNGFIEHSGIIVMAGYTPHHDHKPSNPEDHFLVLSKWGQGKEMLHREWMCPYSGRHEFWRVVR
jgi:hypothetical protein